MVKLSEFFSAINQHRRLRLSITPPPPYPESSSTTPESVTEMSSTALIPTLRIEPPPYKRSATSITPPPPYPSSSSGSQESCHIEDVRTPSAADTPRCGSLQPPPAGSRLQVHRDERGRLSLPETAVREPVDIFSPTFQPNTGHHSNSNPTLRASPTGAQRPNSTTPTSNRGAPNSNARVSDTPPRISTAAADSNVISVLGPEFSTDRPGVDCPQCGLSSNNMMLYSHHRNPDRCDTQGERMCTISK